MWKNSTWLILIFSSSASFWTVNDVIPVFSPFFSPLKISQANRTIFYQFELHFWLADLNLVFLSGKPCFNFLPVTLFLHNLKEDVFKLDRIRWITSFSLRLNWKSIASKGVLSSHAISTIRSTSAEVRDLSEIFIARKLIKL